MSPKRLPSRLKQTFWLGTVSVLLLVSDMVLAQPPPQPDTVRVPSLIRPLPGGLDKVEVLNSNSPEVVQSEGILTSTLAEDNKSTQQAHLNHSFNGRFNIFLHHIAKADPAVSMNTLYVAIILHNSGSCPAKVEVQQAASYLSQPDAPFMAMPAVVDNADGTVFAGPGDRVMNDVLREKLQSDAFRSNIQVPAGSNVVLTALAVPVKGLTPLLNGRSLLAKLRTDRPVEVATVAMFGRTNADGSERPPTDDEWFQTLLNGALVGPREKPATSPEAAGGIVYGRVAGVAIGDTWIARIADSKGKNGVLRIPKIGESITFPISTVRGGTFGTGQVQAAPLLKREPDTAFAAHGNYGIKYDITIPLANMTQKDALVLVKLQTPLKKDDKSNQLVFYKQPSARVFFRGTVRTSYIDSQKIRHEKYTHLVQHQGEQGVPLVAQYLKPKEQRTVRMEFYYPPDATPPQVVTIETTDPTNVLE